MLFAIEDTVKVHVFMLPSISDVQELAGNPNIGGFYNATAQLAYGFVPEKLNVYQEGYTAETVSMHEYAHHMLLGSTDRYIPIWASEGLATLFMTARFDADGGITIGAPNPAFSVPTYSGSRWSIEKLLRSDNEEIGRNERVQLYSRGWALAHYLWLSGKRPGQYVEFIAELNRTGDALAAGRKAFGSLDALDREVNAYLRGTTFPASTISKDQLDTPTEISIRELSLGEEAILRYRMISLLGVDKERSVKLAEDARPVAAQYPDDAFVQRTLAEIEYDVASLNDDMGYEAAELAADRALALDPGNLMAMLYKGRIAVKRGISDEGTMGDWTTARGWFVKANRANPNHPLPFVLLYDSYVAADQVAPEAVVGGLFRAVVLMPQDISLRARAAVELIRQDLIPRARTVIAPAAFYPHLPADNPMRKLVEKIDSGASREGLLKYIEDERFSERYNDFLALEIAEEDKEKEEEKANTSE